MLRASTGKPLEPKHDCSDSRLMHITMFPPVFFLSFFPATARWSGDVMEMSPQYLASRMHSFRIRSTVHVVSTVIVFHPPRCCFARARARVCSVSYSGASLQMSQCKRRKFTEEPLFACCLTFYLNCHCLVSTTLVLFFLSCSSFTCRFVRRQDLAGDEQARALLGMADWLHAQGFHRQAADTYLKVTSCGAPALPPLFPPMLCMRGMMPEFSRFFFLLKPSLFSTS